MYCHLISTVTSNNFFKKKNPPVPKVLNINVNAQNWSNIMYL